MGKPIFTLTGRRRVRRPWYAPWTTVDEFEVRTMFYREVLRFYSRADIQKYWPQLVVGLPK